MMKTDMWDGLHNFSMRRKNSLLIKTVNNFV